MTPKTLARRVSHLEEANPAGRILLYVENYAGETPAEAEARCRWEQGFLAGVEADVVVTFLGLND